MIAALAGRTSPRPDLTQCLRFISACSKIAPKTLHFLYRPVAWGLELAARRTRYIHSMDIDKLGGVFSCRGTACRAPTADPWTGSFVNSHGPDLGYAPITCEKD